MENIILIVGKDDYLITKKMEEILQQFNKTFEDVTVVDLEETSIKELLPELTCVSLFEENRFFWIKNPDSLTKKGTLDDDSLEQLAKYIKNPLDTSYLFFSSKQYFDEGELSRILHNYALLIDLDKENKTYDVFLQEYAEEHKMKMTKEAKGELLGRVNSFQMLEYELEKLEYYALGEEIDIKMVDKVCCRNIDKKIYELTNALIQGQKNIIMGVYADLLDNNEDSMRIISNMISKMNELLYTKKLLELRKSKEEIANFFNVSSGRAYYMIKAANEIPYKKVADYLKDLHELDYNIKSGNIEKNIGLELFLLKA